MTRKKELEKVKDIIKRHYNRGDCGIFNRRNLVNDPMSTIFKGEYFTVDLCEYWAYFEVFGTSSDEFKELENFYWMLDEGEI